MTRPWFQMCSRDWLDNKELRRCSPLARGVLADLMCLAHEGLPYGHLCDKVGPLTDGYMASRCVITLRQFRSALAELLTNERVHRDADGRLYVKRMVEDEDIRLKRASGGSLSVDNPNCQKKKPVEGYPSDHPYTHPSPENDSRARARAECESVSESNKPIPCIPQNFGQWPLAGAAMRARFPGIGFQLVMEIINLARIAHMAESKPKIEFTDAIVAQAVERVYSVSQYSPVLFKTTVPNCIAAWAADGIRSRDSPPVITPDPPSQVSIWRREFEEEQRREAAAGGK